MFIIFHKSLIYYINNCNYLEKNSKEVQFIDYNILKNIYDAYVYIVKKLGLNKFDNIENEDFMVNGSNNDYYDDENSISEESSKDLSEPFFHDSDEKSNSENNGDDENDDGNINPDESSGGNNILNIKKNNKQYKENKKWNMTIMKIITLMKLMNYLIF